MDGVERTILVTGADGFIGRNLVVHLRERPGIKVQTFTRRDELRSLREKVASADAVVHLAGVNRPSDPADFETENAGLTETLCNCLRAEKAGSGRSLPLIFTSSAQAGQDNPYGRSKLAAEEEVQALSIETAIPCSVFRLPGVFGKWCKPDYNSVVATFCHNIARNIPIRIDNASSTIDLVYVDDVVEALIGALEAPPDGCRRLQVKPVHTVTVGHLADQIRAFEDGRRSLIVDRVGQGFVRALYATYISYLPGEFFSYEIPCHADSRGVFVEMLKTLDSGQISFFTARAGVTRGGHYHHSKTEKFLVINGQALFRFRHLLTGEIVELSIDGALPRIVDTIPGWAHDITNIGSEELVVMLWANENFDRERPDTIISGVR
jgi:UDP-2-acetamido-2,6-beta-L-arabino-hexul-4-ose reductase